MEKYEYLLTPNLHVGKYIAENILKRRKWLSTNWQESIITYENMKF